MQQQKLSKEAFLMLENFVLREELLREKINNLQNELGQISQEKGRYLLILKEELNLPSQFEIDLKSQSIFFDET